MSGGDNYASAKYYFYISGTTTPAAIYTDADRTTQHTNPVIADAGGVFAPIWLDPLVMYRRVLKTTAGATISDIDPYPGADITRDELGAVLYPQTVAEVAAAVTPSDYAYPAGNVLRYGTNTIPGTTDMTAAIQAAIDVAKNAAAGEGGVFIPKGKYRITSSLNLTNISLSVAGLLNLRIEGEGKYNTVILAAFNGGSALDLSGSSFLEFSNFGLRPVATFTPNQMVLCARLASNASAGDHSWNDMWIEGTCANATMVLWGSEQQHFYKSVVWSNVNKPAFVSAVKMDDLGFTPTSDFQTLGTGEGGAGMCGFFSTRFGNETGVVQTSPLLKLYGALCFAFDNCFFACHTPNTIDINHSRRPSTPTTVYYSSISFRNCSDENAWSAAAKNTIYFSSPWVAATEAIKSLVIDNCLFFNIFAEDGVYIDNLRYLGGKYSNTIAAPTGSKMSVYRLENSYVAPSKSEKALTYTIRNTGVANLFIGINTGNVALGTDTGSSIIDSSGNTLHKGYIQSASPSGGIGYSAGAGGTVTQITSASTSVTLDKVTGRITTVALTTAAGAEEVFQVLNSTVTSQDVIVVSTTYAGAGTPAVTVKGVASGGFVIVITNLHAANALDAVLVINFAVIKGITS
jgi:hypothetical protein